MTSPSVRTLADTLWTAAQSRTPCAPLSQALPELDVATAYRIQGLNLARAEAGEAGAPDVRVGHKIGITSKAVQDWLKCDAPDFGGLLASMQVPHGETVQAGRLMQPRIEAELAFVLAEDLVGKQGGRAPVTMHDVLDATAYVVPALEIIDSRIADWAITYPDTIADNASSGLFVLGPDRAHVDDVDFELCGMVMRQNGTVVSTGAGLACLGHPAEAVAWLANTFAALGTPLKAGDVVLSGALGPVCPVKPGDRFTAAIAGVGRVAVAFAAD